ncbi:MAG: phosphoribosylformylglycinamidine synthase subunit PurS, partial [Planctomycetes bacterium]|nr:phosphoribosylformylglycinamidine synthase subunit PurS [Planctomycetota bacterium]
MDAWRIEVAVQRDLPDPAGRAARNALEAVGLAASSVRSRRGYLLGTDLARGQVEQFAREVLVDPIQEEFDIWPPGADAPAVAGRISVLPLPGVTDPVAHSV